MAMRLPRSRSANFWSRVLITIWCRVSGAAQDAMNKAMTIAIQ